MATSRGKLTERYCEAQKHPAQGENIIRDGAVAGFVLRVGVRTKSFELRTERRVADKRRARSFPLGEFPHVKADAARGAALDILGKMKRGEPVTGPAPGALTLAVAWERFKAALKARPASPKTIAGYELSYRHLEKLHDTTLRALSDDPALFNSEHERMTRAGIPVMANLAARFLRATYRHAKKSVRGLPDDLPTSGVAWNEEKPRTTLVAPSALPGWFAQLLDVENLVQRELALFILLSGLRREDAQTARWDELDLKRRVLHRPRPKGGEVKAFDLVLSRQMIRCLWRAKKAGKHLHEVNARTWIFPSVRAASGHVEEIKSIKLSHHGHKLRRTYSTLAREAGIPKDNVTTFLNHAGGDVTDHYIIDSALLKFMLGLQQTISDHIIKRAALTPEQRRELNWVNVDAASSGAESHTTVAASTQGA